MPDEWVYPIGNYSEILGSPTPIGQEGEDVARAITALKNATSRGTVIADAPNHRAFTSVYQDTGSPELGYKPGFRDIQWRYTVVVTDRYKGVTLESLEKQNA